MPSVSWSTAESVVGVLTSCAKPMRRRLFLRATSWSGFGLTMIDRTPGVGGRLRACSLDADLIASALEPFATDGPSAVDVK
jgi:hypothetical protein